MNVMNRMSTPLLTKTMEVKRTASGPRSGVVDRFRGTPGDRVSDWAGVVDFAGVE